MKVMSCANDSAAATISGEYRKRISRTSLDLRSTFSMFNCRQVSLGSPRFAVVIEVEQVRPFVELADDDHQGTLVLARLGKPQVAPNPRGRLDEDGLLPGEARRSLRPAPVIAATASRSKPAILGWVEHVNDRARLRQMPRDRAGGRILARLEMLAGVVVKAKHARETQRVAPRMPVARLHRKEKWTRVTDSLLPEGDRVV